ncbi:MAG: hypothetical protein V3V16_05440 [Melioribacteraceae bacterium]
MKNKKLNKFRFVSLFLLVSFFFTLAFITDKLYVNLFMSFLALVFLTKEIKKVY